MSYNISPIESLRGGNIGKDRGSPAGMMQTHKFQGGKQLSSEVVLLKNENNKLKRHIKNLYELFRMSKLENKARFSRLEKTIL